MGKPTPVNSIAMDMSHKNKGARPENLPFPQPYMVFKIVALQRQSTWLCGTATGVRAQMAECVSKARRMQDL